MAARLASFIVLLVYISCCLACVTDADCYGRGSCVSSVCRCQDNYATYGCDPGIECCYRRKSQLVSILLLFFLGGWGVDKFYVGCYAAGVVRLLCSMVLPGVITVCLAVFTVSIMAIISVLGVLLCSEDAVVAKVLTRIVSFLLNGVLGAVIQIIIALSLFSWFIIDLVRYATFNYTDCNGVGLAHDIFK